MKRASPTILVVDDESEFLKLVKLYLEARSYQVITAADASQALIALDERQIDLVLLDIMLPGMDGFKLCACLREKYPLLSIIILSARELGHDKVYALDMGADDYITKPFGVEELLARVKAVLRRSGKTSGATVKRMAFDGWQFDPDLHRLFHQDGDELRLTPIENALLKLLVANAGKVVMHRALLSSVWGQEYLNEEHYLWTYIRRLRHKLRDDAGEPHLLFTVPGVGYQFTADVADMAPQSTSD